MDPHPLDIGLSTHQPTHPLSYPSYLSPLFHCILLYIIVSMVVPVAWHLAVTPCRTAAWWEEEGWGVGSVVRWRSDDSPTGVS